MLIGAISTFSGKCEQRSQLLTAKAKQSPSFFFSMAYHGNAKIKRQNLTRAGKAR